jgi:glucan phosphoethanolaminetransferase (alkaline phosphatase superfamily)
MLEFLAAVAGITVVAVLWNTPIRLLRVSACAAFLLAGLLAALAFTGWPSYRTRFGKNAAANPVLRNAHTVGGHHSMPVLALVLPLLLGAAVRRRSSFRRKSVHLAIAILIAVAWLLISFSASLLPRHLPDPLPPDLAPMVLRFAVLHMLVVPVLLGVTLLVVGWRHLRSARRVAVG